MLTIEKRTEDKKYIPVSFEDYLPASDPLVSAIWTPTGSGLTIQGEGVTGRIAYAFLLDGTIGSFYSVQILATAASGEKVTVQLPVYIKDEAYTPQAPA